MAYQQYKQHRLPGYDYTQSGSYFITICTHEREHFFGMVKEGRMLHNAIGRMAEYFLQEIPHKFENCTLDINHFKGNVKRWCNENGFEHFRWQSRFHDHIIRNKGALEAIRHYIQANPINWEEDRFCKLK